MASNIVSVVEKKSPQEGLKAWEVVWRVTDFIEEVGRGNGICSPAFNWTAPDGSDTNIKLAVQMLQCREVQWLKASYGIGNIKTKASVCLLGRDQDEHHSASEAEFAEGVSSAGHRWVYLLSWRRFVEEQDNLIAPDGSLTIIFRFQCVIGELGPSTSPTEPESSQPRKPTQTKYGDPSRVSDEFGRLYTSGARSDVKILVSEQVFPAHRAILATRSPVFAAMIDTDMTEGNTGEILIPDSAPGPVDAFLRFLYSGTITFIDNIPEILHLARKYLVEDLKDLCVKALTDTLSAENALHYLELADFYSLEELHKKIVKVIRSHQEILRSEQWEVLVASHPLLTSRVLMELFVLK